MTPRVSFLVVGAGPTGLGAAWRLRERGIPDTLLVERAAGPGGLSASILDPRGYTWDIGGHVQFSHYGYYDDVLDSLDEVQWLHHERESWVWIKGRFVPYPFQNNIHRLDEADRERVLAGMEEAARRRPERGPPADFGAWIDHTFGPGLADLFLVPYNFKVWAYPPAMLNTAWLGERVAVPDLDRIRRNIEAGLDDVSWGPNSTFRFPLRGGTGAIWRAVARRLDPGTCWTGAELRRIDPQRRRAFFADGREVAYDSLVSTMPLSSLCAMVQGLPPSLVHAARSLPFSTTHVVGVGLRGGRPESLRRKCWMYFPEAHSPYYRITVFSNYSPHNVPEGPDTWSLMAEVAESPLKPVDRQAVVAQVLAAMRVDGLVETDAVVDSLWHHVEPHGYPTPGVGRDAVLDQVLPALDALGLYSRGRFGAWKYEVSNQDHSFMQGVEVVDRVLCQGDEPTLTRPGWVNGGALARRVPAP